MISVPRPIPATQSLFVTILAWIFIVLSGLAIFVALIQNIAIHLLFSSGQLPALPSNPRIQPQLAPLAEFLVSHVRWILAGFLCLSVVAFVAAIGLLRRMNWARVAFVALMSLGILWSIAGVAIQYTILSATMPPVPAYAPDEFQSHWEWMRTLMMTFSASMALIFTALFGWIIRRLLSQAIRREFRSAF